jgi:hypothetical protein
MSLYRLLKHLLPLFLLTSCANFAPVPLDYRQGAIVESISSAVYLSINASGMNLAGSGYLVYRRPDQLHLVVLTPFGTTILEAFALGERIVLIYPSQSTAYVGKFDELPDKNGLQGWRLMRWVMDADPSADKQLSESVERIGKLGFSEKLSYKNGLVVAKESQTGDKVLYSKYVAIKGIPVASEFELQNSREDSIRITLDEPDVNISLDDTVFMPRLDGLTVVPLSDL